MFSIKLACATLVLLTAICAVMSNPLICPQSTWGLGYEGQRPLLFFCLIFSKWKTSLTVSFHSHAKTDCRFIFFIFFLQGICKWEKSCFKLYYNLYHFGLLFFFSFLPWQMCFPPSKRLHDFITRKKRHDFQEILKKMFSSSLKCQSLWNVVFYTAGQTLEYASFSNNTAFFFRKFERRNLMVVFSWTGRVISVWGRQTANTY